MFKKGQKVVKVLYGMGFKTGSFQYVHGKNKNKGFISIKDSEDGEPWGHYDIHAYDTKTGLAFENNIDGFKTYILSEKDAESQNISMEE